MSGDKVVKSPSLLRSSAVVGSMTMLSRVLGLLRDIVIAHGFGAGASADAFFVAFKIPNFLRRLFAEGAFSQAFVPVLSEYRTQGDVAEVRRLLDRVAGSLGLLLSLLTALAIVGAPVLAALFAPGFYFGEEAKYLLTVEMLRITFPYLLLISLTAFAGSILNSYDRFAVPAFTPVLLNLSLIASVYWLQPWMDPPVMALAWGVLIAGGAQLLLQLPFLLQLGLLPRPRVGFGHPGVKRIMALMVPALFGVSVSQINLLLDTVLASFLVTGSVSWLYFSDRLVELPLGVFGIAIATVILPSLSRKHAGRSAQEFSDMLNWGLRMVLLIGAPAALALWLLAEPLIITLFHYGALTDGDVVKTAASLRAYSLGLLAFMLIKVLAPGFFSRQDTKTPVRIGIQAMAANMVMNLVLIVPLKHVGLALATALSAYLNAGLLMRGLRRADVLLWSPGWGVFWARLLFANGVMALLLWWLVAPAAEWLGWALEQRVWQLAVLVIAGAGAYGAALLLVGIRPRDLRH
ncbi:murein biosynthesis integral membrane protein MurJ [Motiliproteus sediminis]|uniref:murein biosynthesis integral membrane protein MurJ n=1 Tax=Motiliproteus sediminis TaxID=1468178 RepID=UPI001AF00799|nr:murein biosynthesis integral membrane protein MurJ [Motiliproteus sediminis]